MLSLVVPCRNSTIDPAKNKASTGLTLHVGTLDVKEIIIDIMLPVVLWYHF